MKLHSSRTVDMAQGPIFSGMVRFALPLAASSILQLLFNAADVIVTIFGVCVLRIVWIMTFFQIPQHHSLNNLYVIYPGSWTVTALVFAAGYVYVRRHVGRKMAL